MVHPLGKRPLSWFGPDDWSEGDDPAVESAKRHRKQDEWDDIYFKMPLWKRVLSTLLGEYAEPSDNPLRKKKSTT